MGLNPTKAARTSPLPKLDYIWMDGDLVEWDKAQVHVLTHGLHYGSGIFEGIRCYDTQRGLYIFRLRDHLERFMLSASCCGLEIRYTIEQLSKAIKQVIIANKLRSCYIRPAAFYGYHHLGLDPEGCPTQLIIAAWPWESYLGTESLEKGVKVTISSWVRYDHSMIPLRAKLSGSYINPILAVLEAKSRGCDEALLLDSRGNLCEGPGENVFLVKHSKLITPSTECPILPGITRDTVIKLAGDLGIPVEQRIVPKQEIFQADEMFYTGTAAELVPITNVDGQIIGNGRRGPITKQLQQAFFDVVYARNPSYMNWLEPVKLD